MALLDGNGEVNGSPAGPAPRKPGLQNLLPFTTVALVLALVYVAWTFYSRQQRAKEAQAAVERARQDAEQKQANLVFGSGEVKFLVFSASPGHIKRGEVSQLCYGVVNAESVKIEPEVDEEVKPTSRHCVEIAPKATTTYTITATNAKGQKGQTSLVVRVE